MLSEIRLIFRQYLVFVQSLYAAGPQISSADDSEDMEAPSTTYLSKVHDEHSQ